MKKILYLQTILLLAVYSCSIDNYEAPNASLSGKVIDNVTNEMIENGGVNGGTLIHVFEGYSKQPIVCNSFPDGHFVNSAFFSGNYKLIAIGAFKMISDTLQVKVNSNTEVEIKVLPNVRLKANIVNFETTTATIKIEYEKVHESQTLEELCVVWSTIQNPNMFTFSGGGQQTEKVGSQNLTMGEKLFTITGLIAGKKYYIRAAARTNAAGGYYNYSKTITKQ
ncbi:MAG: DUF3823 domain-containing protein [Dysgonamonadaceae bacterium]|nr:DUF3823 domain-containing protein [Dysgonamonadaceae bacterium]